MIIDPHRHELLRRRRRDTLQELDLLDAGQAGQLWHSLPEDEDRGVLIETLAAIEADVQPQQTWYR